MPTRVAAAAQLLPFFLLLLASAFFLQQAAGASYSYARAQQKARAQPAHGSPQLTGSYEQDVSNPTHDCEQYRWGTDVHVGRHGDCEEPWTRLEENWRPHLSPVKREHYDEFRRYAADEKAWQAFLQSLQHPPGVTNRAFRDAAALIAGGRIGVSSGMAAYVNIGRRKEGVPLLHHIVNVLRSAPRGKFPAARELLKLLLRKGASPSTVSVNFQDNPVYAELLMRHHLDAELLQELAASPSLIVGSFKFDGSYANPNQQPRLVSRVGLSGLHLALQACEAEIREVMEQIAQEAHELATRADSLDSQAATDNGRLTVVQKVKAQGYVSVDDVLEEQRLSRGLEADEPTTEAAMVAGLRLVSSAVLPSQAEDDTAILDQGVVLLNATNVGSGAFQEFETALQQHTARVLRRDSSDRGESVLVLERQTVLRLQDDFGAFYAHHFALANSMFSMDDLYLRTPGNHLTWIHLCARQGMPRTVGVVVNHILTHVSPDPAQGVSSFRFLLNMLTVQEAWFGRTALHLAAVHHGASSPIYLLLNKVVSLLRAPGRDAAGELPEVDSIADVTGRTHASTAAALKFEAYKGFGGGRPSNFPLSAGEVGDWSTASSHGVEVAGIQDTTVTEIEEQRGIVSTAAHIAQALRDARPVVIRAGAANAQYATDYKKMTRSALGSVSESFDCQPGLDLNALALDALVSSLPGLMSTPRKSICRAEQGGQKFVAWQNIIHVEAVFYGQRQYVLSPPSSASLQLFGMSTAVSPHNSDLHVTVEAGDVIVIPSGWSFSVSTLQAGSSVVYTLQYAPHRTRRWDGSVWDDLVLKSVETSKGGIGRALVSRQGGLGSLQSFMPRQSYQQWYGLRSEQEEPQLKIIGAGFGRTGTSTMKKVFESLGFGNCYHMLENVNYKHTELWNMTMQTPQLKRILREGGFQSGVDYPFCLYYREWMNMFPDAKIVLTVRDDPIKWWHSTRRTLYKPSDRWLPFISRVLSTEGEQQELFMWERQLLWEGIYQGRFLEEGVAVKVYENHIREVQEYAHSLGREVLVFNTKQGWKPLCDFLGVPVPREPFPQKNARDTRSLTAFWLHCASAAILLLMMSFLVAAVYVCKTLSNVSLPGVVGAVFFWALWQVIQMGAQRSKQEIYSITDDG